MPRPEPDPQRATLHTAHRLLQQGRLAESRRLCEQTLQADPRDFGALHLMGVIALQSGETQDALALFRRALAREPGSPLALINQGNALQALGRFAEAVESFAHAAAAAEPSLRVVALYNRGNAQRQAGELAAARESFDAVIALQPTHVDARNNLAVTLQDLGDAGAALALCEAILSDHPDNTTALLNCGTALQKLNRHAEALASFERCLSLRPNYANACYARGVSLSQLHRPEEALQSLNAAVELRGDWPDAHLERANVLKALRRLPEALQGIEAGLALQPDHAGLINNRGTLLALMGHKALAVEAFSRALTLRPDDPVALQNRGHALRALEQFDAAVADYERVLRLQPDFPYAVGILRHLRLFQADWRTWDADRATLADRLVAGDPGCTPFEALAFWDDPALHRRAAELFVARDHAADTELGPISLWPEHERLRVGYFSSDFRAHATMVLMAGLFAAHDRERFDIHVFSFGPETSDAVQARLRQSCAAYHDVREHSDREVAALARALQIDIAVDLKGHTQDCRPGIFAARAAPLQVSYLGFPGTMGAPYIDYLFADARVIAPAQRAQYAEHIVYLPHSYQCTDDQRAIAGAPYRRADFGLPEDAVVYCCFNNTYKITPQVFEIWMQILRAVDGSVLWLLEDMPRAVENLRREAQQRGVAGERLVFAQRLPGPEHLARHALADLFLDTLPYNAHTTASDALWAGLPVLTCQGRGFAACVAGSLLHAVGLPELVTSDLSTYAAQAIRFGQDRAALIDLRRRLGALRSGSPLFDTQRFTRNLESAYRLIHRRQRDGRPPEDLELQET